jgi:hypothetical protein
VDGVPAVSSVSCSAEHCCALSRNAEAYCWGKADQFTSSAPVPPGTLEDATALMHWTGTPTRVPLDAVDAVTTSNGSTWLRKGEAVHCVGRCAGRAEQAPFARVEGKSLRAAGDHGCMLNGGGLSCVGPATWGRTWGPQCTQTGGGADPSIPLPIWNPMPKLGDIVGFGLAGVYLSPFGCAVTKKGKTFCWGAKRTLGFAGLGVTVKPVECKQAPAAEIAIPKDHRLTQIAVGAASACGIDETKRIWCWGANANGQLGRGSRGAPQAPAMVASLTDVQAIDAGDHVCAVLGSGEVYCWGKSGSGQLGDGQVAPPHARTKSHHRSTPVRVAGLPEPMAGVTVGGDSSCAWSRKGAVYCWGNNEVGQLGRGHEMAYATSTPLRIDELSPE